MEHQPTHYHIQDINRMMDNGKVEQAIQLIQEHIHIHPKDDNLHYLLGNAYRRLSLWHKAIEQYAEAVTLNPDSPARQARCMLIQILEYRCTDLLNP